MESFLAEHLPRVYRFALRLTGNDSHRAEDLAQETFLKAWQNRDRLRSDEAARVWLLRIAANLWYDQQRRARVRAAHRESVGSSRGSDNGEPCHKLVLQEELQAALDAMDELPDRQRDVLYLAAIEELPAEEIAHILDSNVSAVKTNLSLARKKMRERLRPDRPGADRADRRLIPERR